MINLAKRNLKVFFRDKTAVFFSLLAVFIIIGLYILFLGDILVSGSNWPRQGNLRFMMDSWMMAGLLAVVSITTTMGAFGIMVEDKSKNIIKDFTASPIKRSTLVGGYILSAFVIGMIISVITFILAEIYIVAFGGRLLSFWHMLKVLGLMFLSVMSGTAMVFFVVSFFNSQNAFATASTIIGTLIGFLTGIYIPIGTLPPAVQWVVRLFPVSHAGALFRQVMMDMPMNQVFSGLPQAKAAFEENMGVAYWFGDTPVTALGSILILIATTLLFYGLAVLKLSHRRK